MKRAEPFDTVQLFIVCPASGCKIHGGSREMSAIAERE